MDGVLIQRNVGEWDHARLQGLLSGWLFDREKSLGILVAPSTRVQVKATRFRVPDITVLACPRPATGIITEPPFLCIEILSPSDRVVEMQDRIHDYLDFGVRYVWLIDPKTGLTYVHTAGSVQEVKDGILTTKDPDIRVALSELE